MSHTNAPRRRQAGDHLQAGAIEVFRLSWAGRQTAPLGNPAIGRSGCERVRVASFSKSQADPQPGRYVVPAKGARAETKRNGLEAGAKHGEEPVPLRIAGTYSSLTTKVLIVMDGSGRMANPWPKPGLGYS